MATIKANTDKDYPCIMCGSAGNIVREDKTNPRLKCRGCGFMYDAKDSLELKEKGEIPTEAPKLTQEKIIEETKELFSDTTEGPKRLPLITALPRTPAYVLLSKNRKHFEFVSKRTLRKEVLTWVAEGRTFDLFELTLKKVDAKVDIVD